MNTSNLQNENPQASDSTQESETAPLAGERENAAKWYYVIGDKTCGPVTSAEFRHRLGSGALPNTTFVFCEGMSDWAKALTLTEFQAKGTPVDKHATAPPSRSAPLSDTSAEGRPSTDDSAPKKIRRRAWSFSALLHSNRKANRTFVWWPASTLGSVLLGGFLAFTSTRLLANLTLLVLLTTHGDLQTPWPICVASLGSASLMLSGYLLAVVLRYGIVVAPHKRLLRKRGEAESAATVSCYDYFIDNARAVIVTGAVVVFVLLWQIWGTQDILTNCENEAGNQQETMRNVQADANQLKDQANDAGALTRDIANTPELEAAMAIVQTHDNGSPLVTQEQYETAKELLMAAAKQKQSALLGRGMEDLATAAQTATSLGQTKLKITLFRTLRLEQCVLLLLIAITSGWLCVQARKEHHGEKPPEGMETN